MFQFLADRHWLTYLVWTLLCAAAFVVGRGGEDPTQRPGLHHRTAEEAALQALVERNPEEYSDYIVINSARSETPFAGEQKPWVILLNRKSGGSLESAVVVEMSRDGSTIHAFRRPVGAANLGEPLP
jgi:hypothetical protein